MNDNTRVNELQGKILQAIDILNAKALSAISYDTTVLCTIIDDTDNKNGQYKVSYENKQFIAYSSNTKYRKGKQVYVTVPNGDYDSQKIIVGEKVEDENKPFVFTSPFDTYFEMTENIVPEQYHGIVGLIANKEEDNKLICNFDTKNNSEWNSGYNRLGIRASFRTLLPETTRYGNYGITIAITHRPIDNQENVETTTVLSFDSSEMYGNPYKFESYYDQEAVFDISNLGTILNIRADLYQLNNFKDKDGFINQSNNNEINNDFILQQNDIMVKDLYISLGYDLSTLTRDIVEIYTSDAMIYTAAQAENNKSVELRWMHMGNEDNYNMKEFINSSFDYTINWYRYKPGAPAADGFAGVFWELAQSCYTLTNNEYETKKYYQSFIVDNIIKEKVNTELPTQNETLKDLLTGLDELDETKKKEAYENIAEFFNSIFDGKKLFNGDIIYTNISLIKNMIDNINADAIQQIINIAQKQSISIQKDDMFAYKFVPDVNQQQEKIKVIVFIQNSPYYSNTLVFENQNTVVDYNTLKYLKALAIKTEDGTNGNYYVYDQGNSLKDLAYSHEVRKLSCLFDHDNDGIPTEPITDEGSITWYVPAKNTMLDFGPVSSQAGAADDLIAIKGSSIEYTIKSHYSDTDNLNNTVQCEYVLNGITYSAEKVFNFGKSGTMGSNQTLVIDFVNIAQNYIQIVNKKEQAEIGIPPVSLQVRIYDEFNKDITADFKQVEVEWSWYCHPTKSGKKITSDEIIIDFSKEQDNTIINLNPVIFNINSLYIIQAKINDLITYFSLPLMDQQPIYCSIGTFKEQNEETRKILYSELYNQFIENIYIKNEQNIIVSIGSVWPDNLPEQFSEDTELYVAVLSPKNLILQGPTEIIYQTDGIINYKNIPYKLLSSSGQVKEKLEFFNEIQIFSSKQNSTLSINVLLKDSHQVKFRRIFSYHNDFFAIDSDGVITNLTNTKETNRVEQAIDGFLPALESNKLIPISLYLKDAPIYGIQAYLEGVGTSNAISTDVVIWTQPILTLQNKWPSTTINQWDGKTLQFDNNTSTIVARGISAGKKHDDNTFSGVMLGDWHHTDASGAITENTGIYGFNKGAMTYAFKEDGTAFIGQDGYGRINFDGTEATITSGLWEKDGINYGGMKIDLDDSSITMKYKTSPDTLSDEYELVGKLSKEKFEAGEYYLLDNSKRKYIKATEYDFNETEYYKKINRIINLDASASATDYPFVIGDNFKVQWDGNIEARGTIYADKGSMGGWEIDNGDLIGRSQFQTDNNEYKYPMICMGNSDDVEAIRLFSKTTFEHVSELKYEKDKYSRVDLNSTGRVKLDTYDISYRGGLFHPYRYFVPFPYIDIYEPIRNVGTLITYKPNCFYYEVSKGKFELDNNETVSNNRTYYKIIKKEKLYKMNEFNRLEYVNNPQPLPDYSKATDEYSIIYYHKLNKKRGHPNAFANEWYNPSYSSFIKNRSKNYYIQTFDPEQEYYMINPDNHEYIQVSPTHEFDLENTYYTYDNGKYIKAEPEWFSRVIIGGYSSKTNYYVFYGERKEDIIEFQSGKDAIIKESTSSITLLDINNIPFRIIKDNFKYGYYFVDKKDYNDFSQRSKAFLSDTSFKTFVQSIKSGTKVFQIEGLYGNQYETKYYDALLYKQYKPGIYYIRDKFSGEFVIDNHEDFDSEKLYYEYLGDDINMVEAPQISLGTTGVLYGRHIGIDGAITIYEHQTVPQVEENGAMKFSDPIGIIGNLVYTSRDGDRNIPAAYKTSGIGMIRKFEKRSWYQNADDKSVYDDLAGMYVVKLEEDGILIGCLKDDGGDASGAGTAEPSGNTFIKLTPSGTISVYGRNTINISSESAVNISASGYMHDSSKGIHLNGRVYVNGKRLD